MINLDTAILIKTRELLEKGWIRGCLARDKDGEAVQIKSDKAVSFCLIGGLHKARQILGCDPDIIAKVHHRLRSVIPRGVVEFNNSSTKKQVLDALDEAIHKVV